MPMPILLHDSKGQPLCHWLRQASQTATHCSGCRTHTACHHLSALLLVMRPQRICFPLRLPALQQQWAGALAVESLLVWMLGSQFWLLRARADDPLFGVAQLWTSSRDHLDCGLTVSPETLRSRDFVSDVDRRNSKGNIWSDLPCNSITRAICCSCPNLHGGLLTCGVTVPLLGARLLPTAG